MDPITFVQPVVDIVAANPGTAAALLSVTTLQMLAPVIAKIPALWGGNTGDTGAGSGWSKFWRKFAALPIRLPPVK